MWDVKSANTLPSALTSWEKGGGTGRRRRCGGVGAASSWSALCKALNACMKGSDVMVFSVTFWEGQIHHPVSSRAAAVSIEREWHFIHQFLGTFLIQIILLHPVGTIKILPLKEHRRQYSLFFLFLANSYFKEI